jgi:hypothetical protein
LSSNHEILSSNPSITSPKRRVKENQNILKWIKAKSLAGSMAQVVKHMPSNCEVLNSNLSTTKKKKK